MTDAPIAAPGRPFALDPKPFIPAAIAIIGAAAAWGVLSDQVRGAQDGLKSQAAEIHDLQKRQNAQETLEAVTISRLDDLKSSIDHVGGHVDQLDGKIDRLADRRR